METVFIVVPSLSDGGGERLAIDLAYKLDKTQFKVIVVSLYGKTNSVNNRLAEMNNLDIIYCDKKKGIDFTLFKKIKKLFKKYNPTVIHSHLDVMLYLLPYYKKKHIKIHTVHSIAEKEASGLQKLIRIIAFKIKKVIPVGICDTVTQSLIKYYRLRPTNVPTIYNGINTKKYLIDSKKRKDTFTLINAGRLSEVKNQKLLIDIFADFHKQVLNSNLLILGDGHLREMLQNYIYEKELQNHVKLVGNVDNVNEYLKMADVYVITSNYEGMPLSMIEAMASGLPIVSTDVGGIKDIIVDGENGYLFNNDDKDKAINSIVNLYNDVSLWSKISRSNVEKSLKYDFDKMTEFYTKLYRKNL